MASPFNESEWIGQGKEYVISKIPEHVSEAKKQLLKMPDAVEAMIPDNTMPLRDFLGCNLPTKSSEFIPVENTSLFRKKLPCGLNAETLTNRAIPSDQHLQLLESRLGQACFIFVIEQTDSSAEKSSGSIQKTKYKRGSVSIN